VVILWAIFACIHFIAGQNIYGVSMLCYRNVKLTILPSAPKHLKIINIILKNYHEILPILAAVWCDRKLADKHKFALRHGSSC